MTKQLENLFIFNDRLAKTVHKKLEDDLRADCNLSFFAAFVLGKAFKTHEAIILLCKNGYGEDAFMLARTLFELMVMTSYILQDTSEERFLRYLEHDWVTRKEMYDYVVTNDEALKILNEIIDSGNRDPDVIAEVEKEYKRVMEKYGYGRNGWSNQGIAKMAELIGRADAYRTVYRLQCVVGHTNARSMNEYMKDTDEGLVINIGRNDNLVEKALVIAFDFYRMIVEEADKQFSWGLGDALNNIYKDYIQAIGNIKP